MFKLFEHLEYMIIHKTGNLWNFNIFKLQDFKKFIFFEMVQSQKLYDFGNSKISKISGIFGNENFGNSKIGNF